MYTWHVLTAPIEEEGLLGMDALFTNKFELSMKGLLLNGQKVTTETGGVGLDSVRVSMEDDIVIPVNSQVVVPVKANLVSLKHTTALMEPIARKL